MRSAFSFQGDSLHRLYLDESGHSHDPSSDFFVLAGFSIFVRQTHWLEAQIDPVAARFSSTNPREIEFHGNPMRSDNGTWKGASQRQSSGGRRYLVASGRQAVAVGGLRLCHRKEALFSQRHFGSEFRGSGFVFRWISEGVRTRLVRNRTPSEFVHIFNSLPSVLNGTF